MHIGRTVFAQLMDVVPSYELRQCVERYNGNYKVKSFSCRDQFLCMAFAQLTYRESLRDIEACLRVAKTKLYHMGIRGRVSRNTLAHANETRDWRIYADFVQGLIRTAKALYAGEDFGLELDHTVYALDATIIDLCLSVFPWATFRTGKAAVKLHTLLDLRGRIPVMISITPGNVHDVKILDDLLIEAGAIYIIDRAYVDFGRLYRMHQSLAFFVTRAKRNFVFKRLYSQPVDKSTGVQADQVITATGFYTLKDYPEKLRRIRYIDADTKKRLCVSNQQLHPVGAGDCTALQMSLTGGTVLQMDQATFADQGVLWHHRERRQDSNLDRNLRVCARSHCQETSEAGQEPLHNSTDFERDTIRTNTHFTGAFAHRLRRAGD
jgi:hypothetical protein